MITKSLNLMDYMNEYNSLIYDYYGKEYAAYPCIYYRLDYKNSVIDNNLLDAGAYEIIGDLSGYRWHLIYMMPIMFSESMQSISAVFDEWGKHDELSTTFVIPGAYNMQPLYNDIVIFPLNMRTGDESKYPAFIVTGIEKAIMSDKSSYKITVKNYHCTMKDLEKQVQDKYIFVDYFKQIYPEDIANDLLYLYGSYENKWWIFKNNHIDITTDLIYQAN